MKKEERLNRIMKENICYPDGIGVVMALRAKGVKSKKIPGAELWLKIIEELHATEPCYFIGGTQEVI